jgi:starch phosphorylase
MFDGGARPAPSQDQHVPLRNGVYHPQRNGSANGVAHAGRLEDHLGLVLAELTYNLRWGWDAPTRHLFGALAPKVWEATHNPIQVLRYVTASPSRLIAREAEIRAAATELLAYLGAPARLQDGPRVAYFCAEYALADCLPLYSGGLGVLAGDHLKAASDLGLPLAGVGLLYREGYFRQVIDAHGAQRERYDWVDPAELPLRPVVGVDGGSVLVSIPFPARTVHARAWRAQVGRVPLYLLDTDIPENEPNDRAIAARLYGGDALTRLSQEMVLGIGGARLLAALGSDAQPEVYHLNEGHSAFLTLELARQWVQTGQARDFDEAVIQVARRVVFTTHTPVAAGHDVFAADLMEWSFAAYREELGITHAQLMALGSRETVHSADDFSMTVLALRSAASRNGVSQLHGLVSRQMWSGIGIGAQNDPPAAEMEGLTNAVHTATWVGPEMARLFDARLERGWRSAPHQPEHWTALPEVDPTHLWEARSAQRRCLLEYLEQRGSAGQAEALAAGVTADNTLVLGFARRFATYKRATLLLSDPDRLARLMSADQARGVVVVFAGKAHPRDEGGKALVQRIVHASRDARFRGRLLFVEDYDVELARLLVQGSDVWLNTPRRPEEASGTSGMKAVLNGALHVSELDGWWDEAYRPELGWAVGLGLPDTAQGEARDVAEAVQLMDLLEHEVKPLFFERDKLGTPRDWLARVARSITTLAPAFSAHRMLAEYTERLYQPAAARLGERLSTSRFALSYTPERAPIHR